MKKILSLFLAVFATLLNAGDAEKVKERLKNDPYMVPFYTGKILPTPQEVTYSKEFFPLENTGIILSKNIQQNDPRLKLLGDRIAKYGGQYKFVDSLKNDCDTIFAVGNTEFAQDIKVPEKPQGYSIKCFKKDGKNIVAFNGRDHLGFTWAVNSLVQMILFRDDKTLLHAFDTFDWPFIENRGVVGPGARPYVDASRIYPVLTKLNRFLYTMGLLVPRRRAPADWMNWRKPRPEELIKQAVTVGENLKGLGITWHAWIIPMAMKATDTAKKTLNCGSDEDFDIIWKMCEPVLKAGGGICYGPDDYRFPIHPEDKKRFGTAREADIFFINRFYTKMKKIYPKASMSLVHPFYWGPNGVNPWSKESSVEYLKALGERIPKDIAIAWTGPSVKSAGFNKEHVKKYADLIKRPPYLFQNSSDFYHIYRYIYPGDVVTWWLNKGRAPDVYKELEGAMYNSLGLYPDMLWNAMLWNPQNYDAKEAAYQATCKLVGQENYNAVCDLVKTLAYFDQFGSLKQTPFAARNFKSIESKLNEVKKKADKLDNNKTHPAAVKKWASLSWPIRCVDVVLYQGLKKNKELSQFVSQGAATEETAQKEVKFNPDTDQIFTAYNFRGSYKPKKIFKRYATWVYGAKSKKSTMSFSFNIEPYPPLTDYSLLICGRDAGKKENCKIEIKLNDKTIFKGPNPFNRKKWTVQTFKVPLPTLQRSNKLTISNSEDCAKSGIPYFALNYLVVRKIKK